MPTVDDGARRRASDCPASRAMIDQPSRFQKSCGVGAHLGLPPRRYQFSEADVKGRSSRCGDELAQGALYDAAYWLLPRTSKEGRGDLVEARHPVAVKLPGVARQVETPRLPDLIM